MDLGVLACPKCYLLGKEDCPDVIWKFKRKSYADAVANSSDEAEVTVAVFKQPLLIISGAWFGNSPPMVIRTERSISAFMCVIHTERRLCGS